MKEDKRRRDVKIILAIVDISVINLGYFLSSWILHLFSIRSTGDQVDYFWLMVLSVSFVFIFNLYDLYKDWRRKSVQHLVYSIIISMIILSGVTLILSLLTPYLSFKPIYIFTALLIQTILLLFARICFWQINKKMFGARNVYIIGEDANTGKQLADKFLNHTKGWFEIAGYVPLAKIDLLHEYAKKCDIFVLSPNITKENKQEIVDTCTKFGKEILVVPQLYELSILGAGTQQVDDMLVISIKPPLLNVGEQVYKRIFDVIVSLLLLVITSPFCGVLFLLIPLTSKGPALFKQERIGLNGKPYLIYKFRSMILDAEKRTGPVLATDRDPRITGIGRFIRAVRLDELPQLLNVLKGDMSLVGPRPEREYFIKQFKHKYPEYSYRLTVKPGITGLAQVLGNYTTPVDDKLRFDLLYVRNYSFLLDVKILLQTIRVVLQREQAQGVKENKHNQKLLKKLEGNKVINH
ncbi:MAG: sugar transferase [Bacillus sp. (in: firmicutes)]